MNDSYQAIYDAASRKIGHVDTERVLFEALQGPCGAFELAARAAMEAICFEQTRPSAIYRPTVAPDGTMWCALFGPNLMEGVSGFGNTPEEAMRDFDKNWREQKTPTAMRLEAKP